MSVLNRIEIYPYRNLLQFVLDQKCIPRSINQNEYLKLYHRYYIPELGVVKISSIESIDGIEYYFIRYDNKSGCITYPVNYINTFELLHNNKSIETKNIINSKESFTGAEIKFWFAVTEDIDDEIYNGFLSFLDHSSQNSISDSKYYNISFNPNRQQKFSINLDKNKYR